MQGIFLKTIRQKIIKQKPGFFIFLLIVLSAALIASVIRYGLQSYKIPEWDEQHYMRMATEFYRLLKTPNPNTIDQMLSVVPFRQIGYPLLMQPFLMVFGLTNSYFWGIFTNSLLYVPQFLGFSFSQDNT